MDDGGIVGDVDLLRKVWQLLKTWGHQLGLHRNPSKWEWSWLDLLRSNPCPLNLDDVPEESQINLVPHTQIQMLNVPLGNDMLVADFFEHKPLDNLMITVNRLVEFEDSQSASYLLRGSFSIVCAVHFMRTTP